MFVLVKEPETLIRLMEGGVEIPKVDLGIIFNENGRTPVTKFIALNEKEKADLEIIRSKGVPIVIQYVRLRQKRHTDSEKYIDSEKEKISDR